MKLIYYLTKLLTNIFCRIYYKFDYQGLENLPNDKPVVLAPNHVNAFMDPVLIGMTIKREVRFFARGDVFKGAFSRWILNELNISPVYRMSEGYSDVKKNDKTAEECRQLLVNDKAIMMFPEGICIQEKRLRPLKKGLSRIVFQAAASIDFSKDILVIPVGINYSNAKKFRSKAVLDFGKPLSILPYKESFATDPVKTINEFTRLLETKMKPHLVIIENPDNDKLVAAIEELLMKQWIEAKSGDPKDLKQQNEASQEIAEMVNKLSAAHPEEVQQLRLKTENYIQKLDTYQLRDHLLDPQRINKMNAFSFMKDVACIYFGMPFYALGLLFNFPPYYLAKRFSDKKIKNVEFYASVYSNLAMLIWLVYYGIQLLIVGLVFRSWPLLGVYAVTIPLLGLFTIRFGTFMAKIRGRARLLRMVRKQHDVAAGLINERKLIIEALTEAKKTAGF
jgi:1-acyl-sn-glycerol-3-phosphate acyltransferase